MNKRGYRFYVVNVQTIAIDSGWETIADANDRAVALREETGTAAKVMTKPRIGFGAGETVLDPKDDASWTPKRSAGAVPRVKLDVLNARDAGVEPGTYWRKKAKDRHNRVYRVDSCDGRVVVCTDTVTGEAFRSSLVTFVDVFTPGDARENPTRTKYDANGLPYQTGGGPVQRPIHRQSGYVECVCCSDPTMTGDVRRAVMCPLCREAGCSRRDAPGSCRRSDGDARENPPQRNRRQQKFFGSEQDAWDHYNELDDKERYQVRYRHPNDDFVVELKDPDMGPHAPRENPSDDDEFWRKVDAKTDEVKARNEGTAVCSRCGGILEKYFRCRGCGLDSARSNPGEAPDSARAEEVYEMWHQRPAEGFDIKKTGVKITARMVCIGRAHDVVYASNKWEKDKRKTNDYVHTFGQPKVWLLERFAKDVGGARKTVEHFLKKCCNAEGRVAGADLAKMVSLCVGDENHEIAIHSGARVFGGIDQKTVVILDPVYKILVITGGQMFFDERGIVN